MSETVTVLMPPISDLEKFSIRYQGLENQLGAMGVQPTFAQSHDSYDVETHNFNRHFTTQNETIEGVESSDIAVVRDLTIPKNYGRDLYVDPEAPPTVHKTEFNAFLRDKTNLYRELPSFHPETYVVPSQGVIEAASLILGQNVVVKPVSGMASKNVYIGPLSNIPHELDDGQYLVQEYIDTSNGIPELDIHGVHNVRILSINSNLVGAVGRIRGSKGMLLSEDDYGKVYLPEDLPVSMVSIADAVQDLLKTLPGEGKNVIAIDLMRGVNSKGDEVDVVCEVNHRPLRISEYDLKDTLDDPKGIAWLASQWDVAEAEMLAEQAHKIGQ